MSIDFKPLSVPVNTSLNLNAAAETNVSKDPKKLADAAKQFEALMISQMMKSVREDSGGGWLSDGDQTGEDSSMGLAEEQFAQALASSGGLGLAKMVVTAMSGSERNAPPPTGLAEKNGDPGMALHELREGAPAYSLHSPAQ